MRERLVEIARRGTRASTGESFSPENGMRGAGAGFLDHQELRAAFGAREPGQLARSSPPTGRSPPARACRRATSAPAASPSRRHRAAPRLASQRREHRRRRPRSTITTRFSDEQLVALSKVFERAILRAASARSALASTIDDDVAHADAEGRRAAGIGRADVGLRAGRHDEVACRISSCVDSLVTGAGSICTRSAARRSCRTRVDEFDQQRAGAASPWARARG